jgi:hypothetical protein
VARLIEKLGGQGSANRVPGLQGAGPAGCRACRVPGLQGAGPTGCRASRVPGPAGCRANRVPGQQGAGASRVPGQQGAGSAGSGGPAAFQAIGEHADPGTPIPAASGRVDAGAARPRGDARSSRRVGPRHPTRSLPTSR